MHEYYMQKALKLAEKAQGYTNPNPLVGSIIVKNDRIIAEGYHETYGHHHAEINAFNNAVESVEGATMYVTLEPCSHYGKTPPCAKKIIEKKIAKVIIASKDPNPLVSGRGIAMLENAGITVETGVLDSENKALNEIFFHYIQTKRPYVILKTAMSADGKIATHTNDSKWITNEASRAFVHQIRQRVAAIMVGANTVFHDDPLLTTRTTASNPKNPVRIILDTDGRTPLTARLLNDQTAKVIIVTTKKAKPATLEALKNKGAEIIVTPSKDENVDIDYLLDILGERGIDSVLLEGGAYVNDSAMRQGLINKYYSFIAPILIGGKDAPTPIGGKGIAKLSDAVRLHRKEVKTFGDDLMIVYEMSDA